MEKCRFLHTLRQPALRQAGAGRLKHLKRVGHIAKMTPVLLGLNIE